MPDSHLVIASAIPPLREGVPLPPLPALPQLEALLGHLREAGRLACEADAPDAPFERILAQLYGLHHPPGQVPWAALETQTTGTPCAWIRPCHLQLGMDSAMVADPAMLALDDAAAQALLATVRPYMAEAGILIDYQRPDAWLARSPLFAGLSTCSIMRASQEPLSREALAVSGTGDAATLRRMQSEWQMLLAGHPVNEAREASGLPPVNALWIEGAGTLAEIPAASTAIISERRLAQAGPELARRHAVWQAIDQDRVAPLRDALTAGRRVQLTLCGPRSAITLQSARGMARLAARFRPLRLDALRLQL